MKTLSLLLLLALVSFNADAALNASTTAADIVAKLQARNPGMSAQQVTDATNHWNDIITALYTRIKADMQVTSTVATGIPVSTTGTAAAQTGTTTSTGTASSSTIQ